MPLPPDLDQAIAHYSRGEFEFLQHKLTVPPLNDEGEPDEECGWEEAAISSAGWEHIRALLGSCIRQGFYLALLRYADDLKHVPEAAALLEKKRSAAKKGGDARRKKAAPRHKAICKRFRELRKTVPKATARYLRIAKEFGIDEGSVGRIIRQYSS